MTINITDKTPEPVTIVMTKIRDVFGTAMVIKGWR